MLTNPRKYSKCGMVDLSSPKRREFNSFYFILLWLWINDFQQQFTVEVHKTWQPERKKMEEEEEEERVSLTHSLNLNVKYHRWHELNAFGIQNEEMTNIGNRLVFQFLGAIEKESKNEGKYHTMDFKKSSSIVYMTVDVNTREKKILTKIRTNRKYLCIHLPKRILCIHWKNKGLYWLLFYSSAYDLIE